VPAPAAGCTPTQPWDDAITVIVTGWVRGDFSGLGGVVPIGPDMYMLGGLGEFTDFSSSAVKARLYGEASAYCRGKGQIMSPINSTGRDSGMGTYASAEVQFSLPKTGRPTIIEMRKLLELPASD
jgi:hypothetical protein